MSVTDPNGLIHYAGCADICGWNDPEVYYCGCAQPAIKGRGKDKRCTACGHPLASENDPTEETS